MFAESFDSLSEVDFISMAYVFFQFAIVSISKPFVQKFLALFELHQLSLHQEMPEENLLDLP